MLDAHKKATLEDTSSTRMETILPSSKMKINVHRLSKTITIGERPSWSICEKSSAEKSQSPVMDTRISNGVLVNLKGLIAKELQDDVHVCVFQEEQKRTFSESSDAAGKVLLARWEAKQLNWSYHSSVHVQIHHSSDFSP